jgi:hypothetical protein
MTNWDDELWLFTPAEVEQLPDGIELTNILGGTAIKGKDYIDMDTRFGHTAYGVKNPNKHPEALLFTKFRLS